MADYDMPNTMALNNPMLTLINHTDAYIGGSSLIFERGMMKLISLDMGDIMEKFNLKPTKTNQSD
jgi:hypothetical protein